MGKPVDAEMQCRALQGVATRQTPTPPQCPYLRIEIPDQRGVWSMYCAGHRAERQRLKALYEADPGAYDDRLAPITIGNKQTKRDSWVFPGAGKWKREDPL